MDDEAVVVGGTNHRCELLEGKVGGKGPTTGVNY